MAVARQRIHLPPSCFREAIARRISGDFWAGDDIASFEKAFADSVGSPHALVAPSGRAALKFILEALELPPQSEVICSAFGYPVVPFLAKSLGYRVRFADCEMQTLGMDPDALRAAITDETRVVIATHLYGVPCRIKEIADVVRERGAVLIEDCAHCIDAAVDGQHAGTFGHAAYFSFETSKPVNTMGGGMITVADHDVAERIRSLSATGAPPGARWLMKRLAKTSFETLVTHPLLFNMGVYPALRFAPRSRGAEDRFASGYDGDEVSMRGKTGRYTNYQARLGLKQLHRAQSQADKRRQNALRLIGQLSDRVKFQEPAGPEVKANYMLVTALFPDMLSINDQLLSRGVDCKHHYMRDCSGLFETTEPFPNAARAEREVLHLPAYPELSEGRLDRIAEQVRQCVPTTADSPCLQTG